MQLNRSPAIYDVIVKTTVKMKKNHSSWMENIQIILNTERTLFVVCYMFLCSSLLFAACSDVLKFY